MQLGMLEVNQGSMGQKYLFSFLESLKLKYQNLDNFTECHNTSLLKMSVLYYRFPNM